jgi:hypothetical protein
MSKDETMYHTGPIKGKQSARGENIVRIAKKAVCNRRRYNGRNEWFSLEPGGVLKALKSGGTAVVLNRADGGPTLVEVVHSVVTHVTRPATPEQRAEALFGLAAHNGAGFKAALGAALGNGHDAVVIDEALDALCDADEIVRALTGCPSPVTRFAAE